MRIKRTGTTWRQLWRAVKHSSEGMFFGIAFVTMVVGIILTGVYAAKYFDDYDAREMQRLIVQEFESIPGNDDQATKARADLANETLALHRIGVELAAFDDDFSHEITTAAATGIMPDVTRTASWDSYLHYYVPLALVTILLVTSEIVMLSYISVTRRDKAYLADLPWKRVWPFLFALCIPFLWVPLGISYTLMRKRPPQERAQAQARDDQRGTPVPVQFTSDVDGARDMYTALRGKARRAYIVRRQEEVKAAIAALIDKGRQISAQLKEAQAQKSKLLAEQRTLAVLDPDKLAAPSASNVENEFARLLELPGFGGIRPVTDGLELLLHASTEYQGARYDLGDWRITLTMDGIIRTEELRSGVRPSWDGRYPVYRLAGGRFCFGTRQWTIEENLRKGQFPEAIGLAVESINSINPGHDHDIPRAFFVLGEKAA